MACSGCGKKKSMSSGGTTKGGKMKTFKATASHGSARSGMSVGAKSSSRHSGTTPIKNAQSGSRRRGH